MYLYQRLGWDLTRLTTWTTEASRADALISVAIRRLASATIHARVALAYLAVFTPWTSEARWTLTSEASETIRDTLTTI